MTGDFNTALRWLISTLVEGKCSNDEQLSKFCHAALRNWDSQRGTDWYTQTKRDLHDKGYKLCLN